MAKQSNKGKSGRLSGITPRITSLAKRILDKGHNGLRGLNHQVDRWEQALSSRENKQLDELIDGYTLPVYKRKLYKQADAYVRRLFKELELTDHLTVADSTLSIDNLLVSPFKLSESPSYSSYLTESSENYFKPKMVELVRIGRLKQIDLKSKDDYKEAEKWKNFMLQYSLAEVVYFRLIERLKQTENTNYLVSPLINVNNLLDESKHEELADGWLHAIQHNVFTIEKVKN